VAWRKRGLEPVTTSFGETFSEPSATELTPMQYFRMYLEQNIFENIVCQTNLYYTQKDGNDTKQLFGVHVLGRIVRMPSYRMLWNKIFNCLTVSSVKQKNWFDNLRNFLHMNNNSNMLSREEKRLWQVTRSLSFNWKYSK
jgi:hypothetical protein